jgi:hypothetical protein
VVEGDGLENVATRQYAGTSVTYLEVAHSASQCASGAYRSWGVLRLSRSDSAFLLITPLKPLIDRSRSAGECYAGWCLGMLVNIPGCEG